MSDERALSVTEAMNAAKRALEGVSLRVVGEVSEFNDRPGYKAAYFTVSDEGAAMSCMMWRDAYLASGVELRCGALVELEGTFSAYVPKGRMQFMVRRLTLAGEGQLRLQVAQLARKLELEGLMRPERKRTLPRHPARIAVVTSPRGKAVHDVIRTLKRRYPIAELLVAGVQVEGADAPARIVEGLASVASSGVDVVLLVRGGGSYEDLMPFNAEEVARAVAAMPMPVVTGIGHEPDTSIADMVADFRASTPTAAAEAVAPACDEVAALLTRDGRALGRALTHQLQSVSHKVVRLAERPVFCDPTVVLGPVAQRLDVLGMSLQGALPRRLERDSAFVTHAHDRLAGLGHWLLDRPSSRFAVLAARLEDLSPLAILTRGYAVCYEADGRAVVRSVGDVGEGDRVRIRLQDGTLGCLVETAERISVREGDSEEMGH